MAGHMTDVMLNVTVVRKRVTKQMQMQIFSCGNNDLPRLFPAIVVPKLAKQSDQRVNVYSHRTAPKQPIHLPKGRLGTFRVLHRFTYLYLACDDHTYLLAPRRSSDGVTLITTGPV